MSRLVVDTDVVSFLFKNHPIAKLYDSELLGHTLMLSFMTVAGSFSGSGARRGAPGLIVTWILSWLFLTIGRFATKWAEITVAAQARGYRIECADAWIASSALLYDIPLVTHNGSDYRGVPGLTLISHRP
jgi:tRNA(fMet)-specific endonuclease VapC